MIDREKVIKGLQCIIDGTVRCEGCGYAIDKHGHYSCKQECAKDAIALLKEQEAKIERLKRPDCEHAEHDGIGCLGYCGCAQDDEPIDTCKRCAKYTGNVCEAAK